jgi:glycosyltransferase involved in cell wall biosynthesis
MNAPPRFSIIMPAYNVAAYIEEAVDSVLQQSAEGWELIIVDDGSTDDISARLARYDDQRIKVIRQENSGASAARNKGWRAATADYLLFMDADDRLRANALERLGAALDGNSGACAAYGDAVFIDAPGRIIGSEGRPRHTPRPSGRVLEPLLRNNFLFVGTLCVRGDTLAKVGGWSDARLGEDWELWCQIAARGDFVYIGEGPVLEYRQHGESTVRRTGRNVEEVFRVIDRVFADPKIRARVPAVRLNRLKRKREAVICAFGVKYCFAAGHWAKAAKYAVRGIWLDLLNPTDLILPGIVAQAVERRSGQR